MTLTTPTVVTHHGVLEKRDAKVGGRGVNGTKGYKGVVRSTKCLILSSITRAD